MSISVLGVTHTHQNVGKTVEVAKEILSKTQNATIALEPSSFKESNIYFKHVFLELKKLPGIKIVFIGNRHAEKVAIKTMWRREELKNTLTAQNSPKPAGEVEKIMNGAYVTQALRDKYFLKRIKKENPDLIIVGSAHAKAISHALKAKAMYIGVTEKQANKNISQIWRQIRKIAAQRNKLFKQRRNRVKLQQKRTTSIQTRH